MNNNSVFLFKTYSGSNYEVDPVNKKIRRLYGQRPPTERQGNDGDWKEYIGLSPVEVGSAVVIVWNVASTQSEVVGKTTMTSIVTEVIDSSVENNSYLN